MPSKTKAPAQSVEVAEVKADLLQPLTGELISPADVPALGEAIRALREHKSQIDVAIYAFTQAVVEASQALGTKTIRAGSMTIKVTGGDTIEWDVTELVKLRAAGLPEERYAELVTEQVSYKVNASVAKSIEGSNPVYAKIIGQARVRVPKRQSASVS